GGPFPLQGSARLKRPHLLQRSHLSRERSRLLHRPRSRLGTCRRGAALPAGTAWRGACLEQSARRELCGGGLQLSVLRLVAGGCGGWIGARLSRAMASWLRTL